MLFNQCHDGKTVIQHFTRNINVKTFQKIFCNDLLKPKTVKILFIKRGFYCSNTLNKDFTIFPYCVIKEIAIILGLLVLYPNFHPKTDNDGQQPTTPKKLSKPHKMGVCETREKIGHKPTAMPYFSKGENYTAFAPDEGGSEARSHQNKSQLSKNISNGAYAPYHSTLMDTCIPIESATFTKKSRLGLYRPLSILEMLDFFVPHASARFCCVM